MFRVFLVALEAGVYLLALWNMISGVEYLRVDKKIPWLIEKIARDREQVCPAPTRTVLYRTTLYRTVLYRVISCRTAILCCTITTVHLFFCAVPYSRIYRAVLIFFFFPVPTIVLNLLFSLPPSRNSDPGSHSRLFSPRPHDGSCVAFLSREYFGSCFHSSTRVVFYRTVPRYSTVSCRVVFGSLLRHWLG